MSKSYWTCAEDFDADMLSVSDFCDGSFQREKEAPSDHTRKARSKPSIYDDAPEEEEEIQFRPGRGYPLVRKFTEQKPGGFPSFLQQHYQTAKEIREVCGLGFSNDLIEHSLKGNPEQSVSSDHKQKMPDIRLAGSPTSDPSSKCSTPSSSPLTTSNEQSPSRSPKLKHKPEVVETGRKIDPVSIYKQGNMQRSKMTPPPIYDILRTRNGKPAENVKGNDPKKKAEKPKDYMVNIFTPVQEKSFNINSKIDFPELE